MECVGERKRIMMYRMEVKKVSDDKWQSYGPKCSWVKETMLFFLLINYKKEYTHITYIKA